MGVRPARPEDAAALARVQTLGWRQGFAGLLPAGFLAQRVVSEESWQERLASAEGYQTFVGEAPVGSVAGFATVGPSSPPSPDASGVGQLYALYMLAEAWGTGLGYALHEAALAALRAQGFVEAVLWSLVGNERALAFYRRQGWEETSITHVEQVPGADLPMQLLRCRIVRS